MSANIDLLTPTESLIDLTRYSDDEFVLPDHVLTTLFDDLLLAEYTDVSQDGKAIKRGDIWIPLNTTPKAWRVAEVVIAGVGSKNVKVGDHIVFPNDKGVPVSKLQYNDKKGKLQSIKYGIFLNEERLFGLSKPVSQ